MELVLLVAVVLSAATNIVFIKQAKTTVNMTVPVPEVYVTVEAPESVGLQAVETVDYDYSYLEAILEKLVDLQNRQQALTPNVIPSPTLVPQYPMPYPAYPTITYGETRTDNEIEIDGVKGKQFPAR